MAQISDILTLVSGIAQIIRLLKSSLITKGTVLSGKLVNKSLIISPFRGDFQEFDFRSKKDLKNDNFERKSLSKSMILQ